jgi:hypothetical protein
MAPFVSRAYVASEMAQCRIGSPRRKLAASETGKESIGGFNAHHRQRAAGQAYA